MNTSRGNRKKNVRLKSEVAAVYISQPFDFRHDIHVGHENYEERAVDSPPLSPPGPCPGSTDGTGSGGASIPSETVSQFLKEELLPALRLEIGDIVESKIKGLLNYYTQISTTPHCQTCSCPDKNMKGKASSESIKRDISGLRETENTGYKLKVPIKRDVGVSEYINVTENEDNMKLVQVNDAKPGDERYVTNTLNNPLYHHREEAFLMQTQLGTKLVKYSSDLQLITAEVSTSDRSLALERSNTLPGLAKNASFPERIKMQNQTGRVKSKSDERECMAHALKWHVEELVDGVVFKDSELPDNLLADECLTEEECSAVRQKIDRKDQVRALLRIIKGRDMDVLKKFLRNIRSHNESLADRIQEKFEQNIKEEIRYSKCAFCKLTSQVNLKYIIDSLWKHSLIEDGLFNLIVETDKPTGAQGDQWNQVIHSLNNKSQSVVRRVLVNALRAKNHYYNVAQGVEWMINAFEELKCRCQIQHKAGSFTSLVSSILPQTSASESVADSISDISRISENRIIKRPAQESFVNPFPKINMTVSGESQQDIEMEQSDPTRLNIISTQQSEMDNSKQGNNVKQKSPVQAMRRGLVKQRCEELELKASAV